MLENNNKRYSLKNTSAFKNTTASHDCFLLAISISYWFVTLKIFLNDSLTSYQFMNLHLNKPPPLKSFLTKQPASRGFIHYLS